MSEFRLADSGTTLPPGYPGAPLMAVLARALVDRGHEVATISTDYTTPVGELAPFRCFRGSRVTVYFCPQRFRSFRSHEGRRGRALDFFRYERDCLKAAIADFAPDVAHAHWTYEFAWAALDSGVPTVATAHDSPRSVVRFMPGLYRVARYLMARQVLPRCEHLTAVSPDLAAELRSICRRPIEVIPNPISRAIREGGLRNSDAFEKKTFLMVLNGWNELKNAATALKAFGQARAADPMLSLVCYGAAYESEGVAHRWAQQHRLDAGVEFRGPVDHGTILKQMRNSTALVHPSRLEACCMSIAEAMSVGLPVIAGRRTGGVPWQLDNGRAGILADVGNVSDLAGAMVTMTRDRSRWAGMSAVAVQRAEQLFDVDQIIDQYCARYRSALGAGAAPASNAVFQ